ncbi:NTP transferase domain-containing protein [Candidatus Woesearchaeota archaeon]|nr:NTP transferase domain-containing protein [Candidatus Woesearchaeota archaeon]
MAKKSRKQAKASKKAAAKPKRVPSRQKSQHRSAGKSPGGTAPKTNAESPLTQAIILAAGKSTRTWPLTISRPKALLEVANKTILEHNLEQLQGIIKDAVIITGFEGHQIVQRTGYRNGDINITYTEQLQQLGTAHALKTAESKARQRFLVLMGDDIYSREDLQNCLKHERCLLAQTVEDVSQFGLVREKSGVLQQITEKASLSREGLANTGCYVFGREIFSAIKKLKRSERGEYELVDAVNALAANQKVAIVVARNWQPITHPWSLLDANEKILRNMGDASVKGEVEKGATVKGAVSIGKGTVVKAGAYIEGPVIIGENCTIGPNCYIRASTAIGNNCYVGNATEIKNSIMMKGSHAGHLSYVGDSVLGENVNLGASTITANLRHDNSHVKSMVKEKLVDTGRRKLGAIIGDNSHTGIHTAIYPGRKMWPSTTTLPGEVIRKDVEQ